MERAAKRATKTADSNSEPFLPAEMFSHITKYTDTQTTIILLKSAKSFEHILADRAWKLMYIFRWHKNILGNDIDLYNNSKSSIILSIINFKSRNSTNFMRRNCRSDRGCFEYKAK